MEIKEEYFPKISIILVNYNNYQDTLNCVYSLRKVNYPNFNVIIVDNKSSNNSLSKLKALKSTNIEIIESKKNGGFAYGNNIGIKKAIEENSDYVLLLNNDTLVTNNFLNELLRCFFDRNDVGIATCRIMYNSDRDKVGYAGGYIDWKNLRAKHEGINSDKYREKGIEEVTFISGCCMMISAKCIRKVGTLPEDYFMYYEDMDYCIKAVEAGYKLVYNPESVIYHCVSSSGGGEESPFVIEWTNRSRRKLYNKYKRYIKQSYRFFVCLLCEVRVIMKIILQNNRVKGIRAYFRSFRVV